MPADELLEDEILNFLDENYSEYFALLNEFLKSKFPEENAHIYRHIKTAINSLIDKDYVLPLNKNYANLGEKVMENGVSSVFNFSLYERVDYAKILFQISFIGREYLANKRRIERQYELLERQSASIEQSNAQNTLVSKSTIASNEATAVLYGRTEKYYKHQRNAAWIIVLITAANLAIALATFMQTCGKPQQQQLQLSPEQQTLQEKTLQVQREIDSSLRIMAGKDSLKRK